MGSTVSGHSARKVAERTRTEWMTSDDQRPAITCVSELEASEAQLAGGHLGEIPSLGVVAAGRRLQIGEAGAVLDMEQGRRVGRPGQQVRAPGELVVLVRMVDRDLQAKMLEPASLHLSHGSVNEVAGGSLARLRLACKVRSKAHAQGHGQPSTRLE